MHVAVGGGNPNTLTIPLPCSASLTFEPYWNSQTGVLYFCSEVSSVWVWSPANLGAGALGSIPYQTALDRTGFVPSPTTSGHTFMMGWQPLGSAIAPTAIDTNIFCLITGCTFTGPVSAPSFISSALTPGTSAICPNGTGGAFTTSGCTLPDLFTPFSTVYNVSSTRAWNNLGTSIYQNLTGKPMQVNGYGAGVTGGSTANIACKVDTVSPPVAFVVFNNTWGATVASGAEAFSFLVPNNYYYECATANDVSPSPVGWYETY